jgi:hypothetical protein
MKIGATMKAITRPINRYEKKPRPDRFCCADRGVEGVVSKGFGRGPIIQEKPDDTGVFTPFRRQADVFISMTPVA